jgi:phage/plasmid-associated DNA primase
MARAVQRPAEQGDVAVVMRGEEGCGKGIVARALLFLFGQHGLHVTNAAHLVGHFNEHLQCCVMLFSDEAFYAGAKQYVGVLKAIITEPTLAIEAKYRAVVEARNFLHVIMASNEEWVVPASLEARRFFVLDVSNEKTGDFDYFRAIQDELEAGGYAAMLHDLLNVDLSDFKVAAVPQTEGLATQKKLSLKTHERWWVDVLQRGYVWKSKLGLEEEFHVWHERVATDLLFNAYLEYARSAGDRYPISRESFGRFVVQIGGKKRQFAAVGSVLIGEHFTGGVACASKNFKPVYGYFLGSLSDARKAFTDAAQLPMKWEDEWEKDSTSPAMKSEDANECEGAEGEHDATLASMESEYEWWAEKAYSLAFSDEDERRLEDQKTYASLFDEDDSTSANESEENPNFSFFDEDPPFSM